MMLLSRTMANKYCPNRNFCIVPCPKPGINQFVFLHYSNGTTSHMPVFQDAVHKESDQEAFIDV
jgi:hypothetical protein